MERKLVGLLSILALVVLLAACTGSNELLPIPDPDRRGGGYIQTADSFAVTIERSGAPVYIDTTGLINFLRATGSMSPPIASRPGSGCWSAASPGTST